MPAFLWARSTWVYGNPAEISGYLIPHPIVRKVTFTGSTPVGKQLAGTGGQHMKRVTMGAWAAASAIVCDDADIALAVADAGAKFRQCRSGLYLAHALSGA